MTTLNYAQQNRNPARHAVAVSAVVLFHLLLGYALLTGLARKVVEIYQQPVAVAILTEAAPVQAPEVPPPPVPPPPPKPKPIPKPVVPPPKPKPPAPRPKIPVAVAPTPPAPAPAPVVSAVPRPAAVGVVCPNHLAVRSRIPYPALAQRQGLSGEVLIEFTVGTSGQIGNISVLRSTNAMFESAVLGAVRSLHCVGQGQPVRVRVPFAFRIDR